MVGIFDPIHKRIDDTITVATNKKIQFRDTGIYIYSNADGQLTISSDGSGDDDIILSGNVTFNNNLIVSGDFTFGDAVADSFTINGTMNQGTNSSPLSYTAGTPLRTLYATNAGTSGSTNAEPLYIKSVLTGEGQVGGRCYFLTYSNVASGPWINAVKADIEFGSSGSSSGLASALCAEMTLPSQTVPSGQYYPLEIEWIGGSSTSTSGTTGSGTGCIYINATGTVTDFDDHAGLFWLNGVSAGAGHILSADSHTIRAYTTSSMTSKYIPLSSAENALTMSGATITAGTLTDGTASISSGAVSGVTTLSMSGNMTMSGNTVTLTHSGTTSLTITSTSGTVAVESVTFTGAAISGVSTIGMSDDLTMSKNSANITHSGTTSLTITSTSGSILVEGATFSGNNVTVASTGKLYFQDTGTYIYSSSDGVLDIVSDNKITLSSPGAGGIIFGGEIDWGAATNGPDVSSASINDELIEAVAKVDTENATAAAYATQYNAMTVNKSQNQAGSAFVLWNEMYVSASVDLTGFANVASVWGQVECSTSVTGPDQSDGDFMCAGYFNFKTGSGFETGGYVNGVRIQSEVSNSSFTQTASTTFAGIEILTKSGSYQPWTDGVLVNMAGATTAFTTSGTSASATGRAAKFAGTISAANHGDGYGLVEAELTLTGTQANHTAAFTAWVNTDAGDQGNSGLYIMAQNNGIWEGGNGSITDAICIFGMRMQYIATSTDAGGVYPFSMNISNASNSPTALFHIGTKEGEMSFSANTDDNMDKKIGVVPFYDAGGTIGYINIYSAAT